MKTIIKVLLLSLVVAVLSQCKKEPDPFVTIPDNNFLDALIKKGVDKDGDGIISKVEAAEVTFLYIAIRQISDLKGIEAFVNLDSLICDHNYLAILNVSNSPKLRWVSCEGNKLTSLDVSSNPKLFYLNCNGNSLTSLDVSNNPNLKELRCGVNSLKSLNVSRCYNLSKLACYSNLLTNLDVSECSCLSDLSVAENLLTSLDVSNNSNLTVLLCGTNLFTSLDVSKNTALKFLLLPRLPSLSKVCVWTMPFPPTGVFIDTDNSPNVYFTTDCNK
jgi:hypothetical protein